MTEKGNVNAIEILVLQALSDSYISYKELFSTNNVLKEYNETKEEIKILKLL